VSAARSGWSIAPGDPGYPGQLADLGEPGGPVLHGLGVRERFAGLAPREAVTIVGSRRASGYGLRTAEHLAADLASAGVTVISGMAIGIDAAAHRGALAAEGTTVAVLAGGADVVYPARHAPLHRRIAASGAVVSDKPAGTLPRKQDFPARNRIMAALAEVVVVVEAAERSGSLITADLAQELGRDLAAVPGRVGTRTAAGTNQRLKDGAALVRDAQDVLDLLAGVGALGVRRCGPPLDAEVMRVLSCVTDGTATADAVAAELGVGARDASVALARLELLGYLARDLLGSYAPTGLAAPAGEGGGSGLD
jgi:DNA processing protein